MNTYRLKRTIFLGFLVAAIPLQASKASIGSATYECTNPEKCSVTCTNDTSANLVSVGSPTKAVLTHLNNEVFQLAVTERGSNAVHTYVLAMGTVAVCAFPFMEEKK